MIQDSYLASLSGRFQRPAFVDEVGLGAIAFELVACAVMLPRGFFHPEVDDSKKLKHEDIYRIAPQLKDRVQFSFGIVKSQELREIKNMFKADQLAMKRAVEGLPEVPDAVFADGKVRMECKMPRYDIPKGDTLVFGIAVASIIAKDYRDHMIVRKYGDEFEEYGVKTNFGYRSPKHLDAIRRFGPTEHHRIWMPVVKRVLKGQI